MDAFNKYEQKAESVSVEDLTAKYAGGADSPSVDKELAVLKAKIGLQ